MLIVCPGLISIAYIEIFKDIQMEFTEKLSYANVAHEIGEHF